MENEKYIEDEIKKSQGDLDKLDNIRKDKEKTKKALNDKFKKMLMYVGFIGAIISAIAYLIITIVMVNGVSTDMALSNQILFSVLGAIVGLLISFLLRNQGIIYAKQNEEAQQVMKEYRQKINETKTYKQLHTISWYILWATIRDIFMKGLTIALSTWFILYIFIEGNGEWGLVFLALANILMFAGFGLVGLATVYDKYLEEHIPVIKQRIKKLKEEELKREQEIQETKIALEKMESDRVIMASVEKS